MASSRTEFIKALRDYAQFLEDNAAVPVPSYGISGLVYSTAEEVAHAIKYSKGVKWGKHFDDYTATFTVEFGEAEYQTVKHTLSVAREAVCEAIPTGEVKTVPKYRQYGTKDVPVVEWKCRPILADAE